MDETINGTVVISAAMFGAIPVTASLNNEIIIYPYIWSLQGRSASGNAPVTINSNIRAGFYTEGSVYPRFGHLRPTVIINPNNMVGGTTSVNGKVVISCSASAYIIPPINVVISAQMVGIGGAFPRVGQIGRPIIGVPLTMLTTQMSGQFGNSYSGSASASVNISSSITGFIEPNGSINRPVTISSTATGSSTVIHSLYSQVKIGFAALGLHGDNTGTINRQINVVPHINGLVDFKTGTISRQFSPTMTAQGRSVLNGHVNFEVVIGSAPTNRARSYLPDGSPVPLSFRHGYIAANIPLAITAISDETGRSGSIGAEVAIKGILAGGTTARAGSIAANVLIRAAIYDSFYGTTIAKIETGVIVYDLIEGVNIAKMDGYTVTGMPSDSISIGKAVGYAVIAPTEIVETDTYSAIIFF